MLLNHLHTMFLQTLITLHLGWNEIYASGAKYLAIALRENKVI
jgi:hypothetical protein